jgi:inorganic pyrophosphatase
MDLAARDPDSGLVRVIIDTPRASRNKYKFDPELGLFKLSRVLPLFAGCLVLAHLIGIIRVQQTERGKTIRNDRLLGVIETPVNKPVIRDVKALPKEQLREIEHFFRSYNEAQGRRFVVTGRAGPQAAQRILKRAMQEAA